MSSSRSLTIGTFSALFLGMLLFSAVRNWNGVSLLGQATIPPEFKTVTCSGGVPSCPLGPGAQFACLDGTQNGTYTPLASSQLTCSGTTAVCPQGGTWVPYCSVERVDVKINGQDGSVTVPAGTVVTVTWTSTGMDICDTGSSVPPWGPFVNKGTSGSQQFTANADITLGLQCRKNSNNMIVQDATSGIVVSNSLCPKDTLTCPNGAIMLRTGPQCTFPACPPSSSGTSSAGAGICIPVCGDGKKDTTEQCDDGNKVNGDGCSRICMFDGTSSSGTQTSTPPAVVAAICGNGKVEAPEKCDDGNKTAGDGCSATCAIESGFQCVTTVAPPLTAPHQSPVCNANVTCVEAGDVGFDIGTPGNITYSYGGWANTQYSSGDSCLSPTMLREYTCYANKNVQGLPAACMTPCALGGCNYHADVVCPTGTTCQAGACVGPVVPQSVCTPITSSSSAATATTAVAALCGNGVKNGSEGCDDGNKVNGDGCSSTCQTEAVGQCTMLPPAPPSCTSQLLTTQPIALNCPEALNNSGFDCQVFQYNLPVGTAKRVRGIYQWDLSTDKGFGQAVNRHCGKATIMVYVDGVLQRTLVDDLTDSSVSPGRTVFDLDLTAGTHAVKMTAFGNYTSCGTSTLKPVQTWQGTALFEALTCPLTSSAASVAPAAPAAPAVACSALQWLPNVQLHPKNLDCTNNATFVYTDMYDTDGVPNPDTCRANPNIQLNRYFDGVGYSGTNEYFDTDICLAGRAYIARTFCPDGMLCSNGACVPGTPVNTCPVTAACDDKFLDEQGTSVDDPLTEGMTQKGPNFLKEYCTGEVVQNGAGPVSQLIVENFCTTKNGNRFIDTKIYDCSTTGVFCDSRGVSAKCASSQVCDNVCTANDTLYCPSDCDAPLSCGNGACEAYESRYNCAIDCASCGDNICAGNENAQICFTDCACTDTDGYLDPMTVGTVQGQSGQPIQDACPAASLEYVNEQYCSGGATRLGALKCPMNTTCSGGACVAPGPIISGCTDTDGGFDINVKGTVKSDLSATFYTDKCVVGNAFVLETYCGQDLWPTNGAIRCPAGTVCRDGACAP